MIRLYRMEPSRAHVKEMFDTISPTYDRLNRILSGGLDSRWRKRLCPFIPQGDDLTLLDIATGTGDQLISLFENLSHIKQAYGLDVSDGMLEIGRKKLSRKSYADKITFIEGSALALPFDDHSLDAATISFGIRNLPDCDQGLLEMYRVLKKEGRLLILEFSLPANPLVKSAYLFYLRKILPHIGGIVSKHKEAYTYLNQTIETFPYGKEFCRKIEKAGFSHVKAIPMTFGSVTIYVGDKL